MKYEVINLNETYKLQGGTLTAICADMPLDRGSGWKRPAVLIAPGGGYWFCSKRENEPVAFEFLAKGYNVFVLEYLCKPDKVSYPEQFLEIACAVDYIKKNAKRFCINEKEIFAVGFSAGGHLVGCLSTNYKLAEKKYDGKIDAKITAAGLIYPVISDKYFHQYSYDNLGMKDYEIDEVRLDEQVGKNTTPAFIFSTFMDKTVPSLNSIKYAEALAKANIPYELHIYKNGGHGMSVANAEINETVEGISRNKNWINDCAEFFRDFTKEKF